MDDIPNRDPRGRDVIHRDGGNGLRRRVALWAVLLVMTAALRPAAAQDQRPPTPGTATPEPAPPAGTDPALWERLRQIDARTAEHKDLLADFEQRRFTALLRKPVVSRGRVRVLGQRMRWDTAAPAPTVMAVDEREVRMYYPQQKTLEVYAIDQRLAALAASPLPRLDVLRGYFTFQQIPAKQLLPGDPGGPSKKNDPAGQGDGDGDRADPAADDARFVAVRMTPTEPSLREHVEAVAVLLDARAGYMLAFRVTDADGEETVIRFDNIRVNAGLAERDVTLQVPKGTKVVRPMENL